MTPQEKTIDLIKRMLAKANAETSTQAEAAAFAAKAAELAAREAIELSDIDWENRDATRPIGRYFFDPDEHDIKRTKTRVAWMEQLCANVCRANMCEIVLGGGNSFNIIGRPNNVEIAAYLCAYLVRFAKHMSWRDYGVEYRRCQREGDVTAARGFRQSWLIGFSNRVRQRLLDLKDELKLEYAQSTALVRLDTELQEAADWITDNMKTRNLPAVYGRSATHGRGYASGTRAGDHVDIQGRGLREGNGGGDPKELGR